MSLDLSPGIYHGVLVEVVEAEGTGLVGDHAAGATVLTVAADGFRTAGQCRVDGITYAYLREGDSLAITPALVADVEDGTPVESLTPNGDAETRLLAVVDLDMLGEESESVDETEDLPRAWIPGEVAGYYPVGTSAAGAIVNVRDTAYGYQVVGRPTDAPSLDQAVIDTPYIALYRTADTSWPTSGATYTRLMGWLIDTKSGMSIVSGIITPAQLGLYLMVLTVRWAGNSSGRRLIRLISTTGGVDTELGPFAASPPDTDAFTQQFVIIHRVVDGETFQAEARQSSGAALDVIGAGTTFQAVRLQA